MREHKAWIRRLGERLQADGFFVVLDQFLDLTALESMVLAQCVKVFLMILTHTYGMKMTHFFPGSSYKHPHPPAGWNDGVTYDEVQIAISANKNSGTPQFVCVVREGHGRIYSYPAVNMSDGQSFESRYTQLRSIVSQLFEDPGYECLRKLPQKGNCAYCDFQFDHSAVEVCHSCKQVFEIGSTSCPNCGHQNSEEGTFVWVGFLKCFRCRNGVLIPTSTENLVIGRKGDFTIHNIS